MVRKLERVSPEKSSLLSLVQVQSHPSWLLLQCFLLTATTAHAGESHEHTDLLRMRINDKGLRQG